MFRRVLEQEEMIGARCMVARLSIKPSSNIATANRAAPLRSPRFRRRFRRAKNAEQNNPIPHIVRKKTVNHVVRASLSPDEFEDFTERLLSAHRFCVAPLRRVTRVERWGRRGLLFDAAQGGQQLFVKLLDQVEQQVLLAGVMVIQRARSEPQAGRELTHADLTETLAGKELQHLVPVLGET